MIRERHVSLAGRPRRYLEAGAGWPVLLLHAFPLNADMWRPQMDRVPPGWRFMAPDLRGFGPPVAQDDRSAAAGPPAGGADDRAGAADANAPVTIDDFAADVDAFLDAVEIPAAVIAGLSMGGYVALALVRRAPERFSGMVLADTRPQADTPEGRDGRRAMIELARTRGPAAVADQMLPKLLGSTTLASRPDVAARARQLIEAAPVPAIIGALEAMMGRPDSTDLLRTLSCSALVLVGAEDGLTPPADAEAMDRAIPRSRLVVLPEAGHLSNLEVPELFSAALGDFLQSNI